MVDLRKFKTDDMDFEVSPGFPPQISKFSTIKIKEDSRDQSSSLNTIDKLVLSGKNSSSKKPSGLGSSSRKDERMLTTLNQFDDFKRTNSSIH